MPMQLVSTNCLINAVKIPHYSTMMHRYAERKRFELLFNVRLERIFFFFQLMNDFIHGTSSRFNRAIYFSHGQAVQINIDNLISVEFPYSATIG